MRTIKFRGQHHITKKWVYGWLLRLEGNYFIVNQETDNEIFKSMNDRDSTEVIPKTIGQFIGLKDKNGKEIYEGDIVKCKRKIMGSAFTEGWVGNVIFQEAKFCMSNVIDHDDYYDFDINVEECKVIGNIYENPELLKDTK